MQSKFLVALAIFIVPLTAVCQSDSSGSSAGYFVSLHSGGLIGTSEYGTAFTSSLVQGIRYQRFAFGVGIGHDAYSDFRTVPLFISVNYDFVRYRGNSFFVQMNTGYSRAWNPGLELYPFLHYERDNEFLNPLIGYRITTGKFNLYLSAGYKFQAVEYGWSWEGRVNTHVRHAIERMALQIGFGFR